MALELCVCVCVCVCVGVCVCGCVFWWWWWWGGAGHNDKLIFDVMRPTLPYLWVKAKVKAKEPERTFSGHCEYWSSQSSCLCCLHKLIFTSFTNMTTIHTTRWLFFTAWKAKNNDRDNWCGSSRNNLNGKQFYWKLTFLQLQIKLKLMEC